MPALNSNPKPSHPDVVRLRVTHDLSLDELEELNLCLRISVFRKLREDDLDELVPWQIIQHIDNDRAIELYSQRCSEGD
jgi:hypothetical protein